MKQNYVLRYRATSPLKTPNTKRIVRLLAWLALLLPAAPALAQVRAGRAAPTVAARAQVLREALRLAPNANLRPLETTADALGFVHEQYQLYYQGVKVEHGQYRIHSRAGQVETVSGEALPLAAGLSVQPGLSEAVALQRALAVVGARTYKWQLPAEEAALRQQTGQPTATYRPQGELVLVGDFRQPEASRPLVLAWKFNIYAHEPVSRAWFYVDAQTGQVVLRDAIIKHVNAPGAAFATRYVGARTSITDNTGSGYRLRETATSKGVTTLNMRKSTAFATAVDFVDNDNNWTTAEYNNANFDNAALDAHLGAQATQDYWANVHGRDSFDDQGTVLLSYVHYGSALDNAYWNGTAMLYGDGSTAFKPLTAIDVCGHEIGHAVCQTTANLVYSYESGALNEGLSDIWGCCVENRFDPAKQVYLIGEDITKTAAALRSMSNPNQFRQPDTYKGTFWAVGSNDNGGVHTNSGVLNYWFYLLSAGGAGSNDFGTTFSVTGISIAKAELITYRAERFYMTASTNYMGARKATLQAAIDLYGLGSAEVTATAQAWRAVGVGDATGRTEGPPTISSFAPTSGVAGTVVTIAGTNLGATFRVLFNGVPATLATLTSGTAVAVTVPAGVSTGLISLTTPSGTATTAALSPANFTITVSGPAPVIASYTPPGGAAEGGAVTIVGTGFSGATAVRFGGTAAAFSVVSATSIMATVPPGATSGPLTVATPNGTATAPTPFVVLPAITGFSPASGVAGTPVTLTGTSFAGALSVKFNGVYVLAFTVVNATTITTTVPNGATTGPVTVRTPSGTATSAASFTVTPSVAITGFSPVSGAVGAAVNIQGRGFSGTTAVSFGGVNAPGFTVLSDGEISATVPTGALTGVIGLVSPLGPATSSGLFMVLVPGGPTISSFTPTFGLPGTAVTITGTNFTGATAVAFNGTGATFAVVSATTITATAPAGFTTGPLSVTTPLNTAISATPFYLPPANDLCAGVIALGCGSVVIGSTIGSTSTGDPTSGCNSNTPNASAGGVFYQLTGTGGTINLSACTNSSYDMILFVYRGSCGSYTCVGSDDDGCSPGGASALSFASTAGTSYLVFVNGYNGAQGDFTLTATCQPFISSLTPAAELPGLPVLITGTNFTPASTVAFGGVAAGSVTYNSPTSLTATVPAGAAAGSRAVVVSTAGVSSLSYSGFEVLAVFDGGSSGICTTALPTTATLADGDWHYLLSGAGRVVLAYSYTGPNLGDFGADVLQASAAGPVRQDGSGHAYLDRNWHLTASGGAFPGRAVQLRFYGLATELARLQAADANATLANLTASHYSGPNEDCDLSNNSPAGQLQALAAPAIMPPGAGWFVAQTTVPDHFSEFYLTAGSAPLPVELVSFTAEQRDGAVQLAWRTASEKNSAFFTVERSATGQHFERIGTVAAQGTSSRALDYGFVDERPGPISGSAMRYYRLRQVDLDGAASYSPMRAVALTGPAASALALYPNPAHNALAVSGLAPGTSVTVFDALGRRVASAATGADGVAHLALPSGLAAGVYVVRGGGQTQRLAVE